MIWSEIKVSRQALPARIISLAIDSLDNAEMAGEKAPVNAK
jgi:hypothetical protein